MPILTWLLRENQVNCAIQAEWAELRHLPEVPKPLAQKIIKSLELYPCDLLFIHRDAEKEPRENRVIEIHNALKEVQTSVIVPQVYICVIPVRMLEAWLLFNEAAIRKAAGNPRGKEQLQIPDIRRLQQLPDPKNDLHQLLSIASGLTGRRQKQFNVHERIHRLADLIDDFSPLRNLSAFQELETEIQQVIQTQCWNLYSED
ncbi:MAG: hypothetical protein HEQ29_10485 [Dolichospermum sp. LBC05a]|nr:hypothetical protein [Dolichospermum sp. OL01]MCO5797181.1 hypothetical protein [Dolichospermum sp. OL03]MCS6282737.1 hypothetical protein [Dolichospermum sp.]QSV61172.1 MAG: hypothetical protein HEQ29_10485 [Dolichospermum sp. LBC05a]